jgi:hypothetical protein
VAAPLQHESLISIPPRKRKRLRESKGLRAEKPSYTPPLELLPDPTSYGRCRRGGVIEHYVVSMPPDTLEDQDDRFPHVPPHCSGTKERGPPMHNLRVSVGHPLKLVPPRQCPSPDLTSYYASKQKVLERLLLLVAKGASCHPRQSRVAKAYPHIAPVSEHQPNEKLAAS